jgi:protease I
MAQILQGKKVAILVANGFEQVELTQPKEALEHAGAQVKIISPENKQVQGWDSTTKNWGDEFPIDVHLVDADPKDYDALLLPGGVINPDHLRIIPQAIEFIKQFAIAGKPIAAICHGPWTLINAEAVRGRTLTSWPSIKIDLINAGALWLDKNVVRDGNLVTSRKPDDIPAFNAAMIELFAE